MVTDRAKTLQAPFTATPSKDGSPLILESKGGILISKCLFVASVIVLIISAHGYSFTPGLKLLFHVSFLPLIHLLCAESVSISC